MFDVHFGITDRDFVNRLQSGYEGAAHWGTDNDGWNVWGEAPGTDRNDADTIHVIVNCQTLGNAIDLAVRYALLWERDLLPLVASNADATHGPLGPEWKSLDGTLLSVSEHGDWAEQYLTVDAEGVWLLPHRVLADGAES